MKRWTLLLFLLLIPAAAWAEDPPSMPDSSQFDHAASHGGYPEPDSGYVTDLAGLLTDEEEERIERELWQTESRTGVEIAVVTIDSILDYPGTANGSIETFATGLFDTWGIGNLPANDGVLLLVVRSDRKARIELGAGYDRNRDGDARAIMDGTIVPRFRDNNYTTGITNGVKALMREFAGVRTGWNVPLILVILAVPAVVAIAVSLFRNGKRGWGWVCVGLILVLLMAIFWLLVRTARHLPRGHSSGWSPGGFGGGFGGGFSGGGGATGSW